MELLRMNIDKVLIVSITPYFLERGNVWFEENFEKILKAKKTQSFFEDNTLYLEAGQKTNLSEILRKLDEMGYEKVQEVGGPGEFSQRGDVLDVFPVNLNQAVRFEFLGNEIENVEKLPVEVKDEKAMKDILKKKLKSQKLFSDLRGLKAGDYLVHLDHGVGIFSGIYGSPTSIKGSRTPLKYYVLEYAMGDKLYTPLGLERKLSRYIGFVEPKISRLSSPVWIKTKRKIKEETEKLARELLALYSQREIATRPLYLPDNEIDAEIAATFSYEETPDQIQAMADIKKDLEESIKPLDIIVCGDVGFGKTEVALRTMAKAVNSGWQAVMICPTTILASQHFQTFQRRLQKLPIKMAMLSRLQTEKEQNKVKNDLKEGKIDILIGTHRVLSNDVEFKNLGLLVIDDEQRFGVRQKEKLKKLKASLDVLSLSATPIPRTLYLALSSLKSISIIQTPPLYRQPIKTFILPHSERTIKMAIEKEIKRGGQVYYLHNRVETIKAAKKFLERLTSDVNGKTSDVEIGVAHGRMNEKELVKVMNDFSSKKIGVLVATTIIENGLDLPNVNTLIVADATRLGLSQAYQIRGRIGRSHIQAFAYFLYPKKLSSAARQRLNALKEAEELGSGYRIALKDLEIRGAGNILGKEQSGNVNRVGLNLYCQILSEAIDKMKSSAQIGGTSL